MSAPYGWPVKPFNKQHPVRGYLNDPRIQDASHAFHFGVDVSAPDGTAVYSVTPGKVFIEDKGNAVAVQAPDGVAFGYWHVAPAVKHHQQVKLHQLLGHIEKGWGHVHFAESLKNVYRDPIRPGALTPFVDMGHPTVEKIMFRIGKRTLPPNKVYGLVNICCIAYDTTPILVPPPWSHMPVAPALLRFRVVQNGKAVVPWRKGVDLRPFRKQDAFHLIYADDTTQNHPNKPGLFVYILAHDWNSALHPNGNYRIDVEAVGHPSEQGGLEHAVHDPERRGVGDLLDRRRAISTPASGAWRCNRSSSPSVPSCPTRRPRSGRSRPRRSRTSRTARTASTCCDRVARRARSSPS